MCISSHQVDRWMATNKVSILYCKKEVGGEWVLNPKG
jgi:hypothetical protein